MKQLNIILIILIVLQVGTTFANNTTAHSHKLELIQYESLLDVQDLLCIEDCDPAALIEQVVSVNKVLSNGK